MQKHHKTITEIIQITKPLYINHEQTIIVVRKNYKIALTVVLLILVFASVVYAAFTIVLFAGRKGTVVHIDGIVLSNFSEFNNSFGKYIWFNGKRNNSFIQWYTRGTYTDENGTRNFTLVIYKKRLIGCSSFVSALVDCSSTGRVAYVFNGTRNRTVDVNITFNITSTAANIIAKSNSNVIVNISNINVTKFRFKP